MVTIYVSENTWGRWRLGRKVPYGVGGFRTSDCIGAGVGEGGGGGWGGELRGQENYFPDFIIIIIIIMNCMTNCMILVPYELLRVQPIKY